MLAVVTYSTKSYEKTRKYNVKMAYKKGKADKVFEYCEKDLSKEFREKNKRILSCGRGGGYWIWKPYVVNEAMEQLEEGDYLFYCDSGAFVVRDLHILTEYMDQKQIDMMLFDLDFQEKEFTKRDVFLELGCDKKCYTDSLQRCATYFLLKKTPCAKSFVEQWLIYVQNYELISDEDNTIYHMQNYNGFRENRHDQSIFSVLSKKNGIQSFQDISQYRYPRGVWKRMKAKKEHGKNTEYPILVCVHRQKSADFTSAFREAILNYFPGLSRYLHYGYH